MSAVAGASLRAASPALALSIVVPLYNEEENIGPLHEAICRAVASLGVECEIILVDDGSRDATFERAAAVARWDPRVRVIGFRRNYGQTAAMAAGIRYALGRVIVTMDGDLQNDPEDIGLLLSEIEAGCDIVVGWRADRHDRLLTRRIPSLVANWIIARITGIPIRDNGCTLKVFKQEVIKRVPLYAELHRFIPAMASIVGARVGEVRVRHHPRRHGVSKYGLSRIFKVLSDLLAVKTITSFSSRPLTWFTLLGLPPGLLGVALVLSSVGNALSMEDRSSVVFTGTGLLLLALSGFLVLVGVLCELVCRTGRLDLARMAFVGPNGGNTPGAWTRRNDGGCRQP